jgi:uncharacterized membrane protein YdjX (TVP38/TMEM64 family)
MIRYKSSRQLSISEFKMPFEAKLDENNRWVVLSKYVCPGIPFKAIYVEGLTTQNIIEIKKEEVEETVIDDFGF